jgi:hypothetical protein
VAGLEKAGPIEGAPVLDLEVDQRGENSEHDASAQNPLFIHESEMVHAGSQSSQ